MKWPRIPCIACGTMLTLYLARCGDHYHFAIVCICWGPDNDEGVMMDEVERDQWGYVRW